MQPTDKKTAVEDHSTAVEKRPYEAPQIIPIDTLHDTPRVGGNQNTDANISS